MKRTKHLKPTIFIGSSVEALHYAEAIQMNLRFVADCKLWSQGLFKLNDRTLDRLLIEIRNSDFAIIVFHPDDKVFLRKRIFKATRDNVVFELGLAIGALGLHRVFFLLPEKSLEFRIPTDLLGINFGQYSLENENIDMAIGTFCTEIKRIIQFSNSDSTFSLSGYWSQRWYVKESRWFLPLNEDREVYVTHLRDSIRAEYSSKNRVYKLQGFVRDRYISGTWEDIENGNTYHGSFQLKINPDGESMEGLWMGFDAKGSIKVDTWEWKRTDVKNYPSENT